MDKSMSLVTVSPVKIAGHWMQPTGLIQADSKQRDIRYVKNRLHRLLAVSGYGVRQRPAVWDNINPWPVSPILGQVSTTGGYISRPIKKNLAVTHIHIHAKVKDTYIEDSYYPIQQHYMFVDVIPQEMADILAYAIKYVWDWYIITNSTPNQPSSFTHKEVQATQNIQIVRRNTVHKQASIKLEKEQLVICPITGISYICQLPAPARLQLSIQSPLASYDAVRTLIQSYYKTGVKMESELEPQVLAGMLLTILRYKRLLPDAAIKDTKKANLFLQQATPHVLSYAVRYFYSLASTIGKPCLSLTLEDDTCLRSYGLFQPNKDGYSKESEIFILNYIRACKGETVKERYILPASTSVKILPANLTGVIGKGFSNKSVGIGSEKVKAKIYTDKVKQQVIQAKDASTEGIQLLGKLPMLAGNGLFAQQLKGQILMIQFLSLDARQQVRQRIIANWPSNQDAHRLADLFHTLDTKAVEDDLLSFTQTVAAEQATWQEQKKGLVNFAAMLVNKGKE